MDDDLVDWRARRLLGEGGLPNIGAWGWNATVHVAAADARAAAMTNFLTIMIVELFYASE
jgi:hypothetical protein